MKYLAYGANMDVEIMRTRCTEATLLGTGVLENFRLMFKGKEPNAYATIEPWEGFSVPYVLWEITAGDEKHLDRFEGFPRAYKKHTVKVDFGGEIVPAMYYAKPENQSVGQPMTHYVDCLARSYERFNFDRAILDEALRLSDEHFQRSF